MAIAVVQDRLCSTSVLQPFLENHGLYDSKIEMSRILQDLQEESSNPKGSRCKLVFVYGTLKRGFGNYWLMQELTQSKHACFLGTAQTKSRFPLVCGPFQVPFLLDFPEKGLNVFGEVYLADEEAIARLDELEGVSKGHYERRQIQLKSFRLNSSLQSRFNMDISRINAEAYFAASHYSSALARAECLESFSEKQAAEYVRRKERPNNLTFLEHVYAWISEKGYSTSV